MELRRVGQILEG